MEEVGCNLVSVSQQIDTTTPYGKNFMYQMAAMAELEWALTSERYKDMHKYKIEHGLAYTGKLPRFGFKIDTIMGLKRVIHDREAETRDIFDYLLKCKSKQSTVDYVRDKYDPNFSRKMLQSMINSDLFIGKVRDNYNFCEPYFSIEYMENIRSLNCIKHTPTGNHYLFTGMIKCPMCGRKLSANINNRKGNVYVYYRCPNGIARKHKHYAIPQQTVENTLTTHLEAYLSNYKMSFDKITDNEIIDRKKAISNIQDSMSRLDYLFEKGRLTVEQYESKFSALENELETLKKEIPEKKEIKADTLLIGGWKDIYRELNDENKMIFWHNILSEIKVNTNCKVENVFFN